MSDARMTIDEAIILSIRENRTVDLTVASMDEVYGCSDIEDSAEVDGAIDAWGDVDGDEFRLSITVG